MEPQGSQLPPGAHMRFIRHTPVNLDSLNQALEPFHDSYSHMRLVLLSFCEVLQLTSSYASTQSTLPPIDYQRQIYELWSWLLASLRDPRTDEYSDPESLQVAQHMAKQNPIKIWLELEAHVLRNMLGGEPSEILEEQGPWYTVVDRGSKWLVECAILGLTNTSIAPDASHDTIQRLSAVATCGLKYGSAESSPPGAMRHGIFGPGGVLWSVMEAFARDHRGIEETLRIVHDQAMNIASIFVHSLEHADQPTEELPSYNWYAHGLADARHKFISLVQDRDPFGRIPQYVRNELKDVHFVRLWDAIWQIAEQLASASDYDPFYLPVELFEWIADDVDDLLPHLGSWASKEQRVAMVARTIWWRPTTMDGRAMFIPRNDYADPLPLATIDVEDISHRQDLPESVNGWGERFYEFDEEDQEELVMDFDEAVSLEAYGPVLDPSNVAAVATVKPEDQRCTICLEDHIHSHGDGRTMKLNTCGHMFHYECIFELLNGTSANSNLCPECRGQFSEQRRKVRPAQPVLGSEQ